MGQPVLPHAGAPQAGAGAAAAFPTLGAIMPLATFWSPQVGQANDFVLICSS